jgi:hypothetical protein
MRGNAAGSLRTASVITRISGIAMVVIGTALLVERFA